ncbi:hypothetical protein ACWGGS_34985 [Streptomyces decoyicus]
MKPINTTNATHAINATVGVVHICRDAGPEARAPEARTERPPWPTSPGDSKEPI